MRFGGLTYSFYSLFPSFIPFLQSKEEIKPTNMRMNATFTFLLIFFRNLIIKKNHFSFLHPSLPFNFCSQFFIPFQPHPIPPNQTENLKYISDLKKYASEPEEEEWNTMFPSFA